MGKRRSLYSKKKKGHTPHVVPRSVGGVKKVKKSGEKKSYAKNQDETPRRTKNKEKEGFEGMYEVLKPFLIETVGQKGKSEKRGS